MRKSVLVVGIGAVLFTSVAAPAMAANGSTARPAGQVTPMNQSTNGGDNGWGNCGHNSSGGVKPSGGPTKGNGGYKKGAPCGVIDVYPQDDYLGEYIEVPITT